MVKSADEAQSVEKPSKSSFFILLAISLHANKNGHMSSYQLLLTAILLVTPIQLRWYINNSRDTKWASVTDFTQQQYSKTGDADFHCFVSSEFFHTLEHFYT